jgi:hypothetical protein
MNFPNRIGVSLTAGEYSYQTVGAVYKMMEMNTVSYLVRVLSRERCGYEYILHQYFSNTNTVEPKKKVVVSYIADDWEEGGPHIPTSEQKKPTSFFPPTIDGPKSPTARKQQKGGEKAEPKPVYVLDGVVMCLNAGQEEGLFNGYLSVENSLSQLDPVLQSGSHKVFAREIRILADKNQADWLSDDIMQSACQTFMDVGKENGVFPPLLCDAETPMLVLMDPHALKISVLQYLVEDTEATTSRHKANKNKICKIARTSAELLPGYVNSQSYWTYKNIFSFPDSWFFSYINYPEQTHWMFIGMQAKSRTFFIYDPQLDKGQLLSVKSAVLAYIDLEAQFYVDELGGDASGVSASVTWTYEPCYAQNQTDKFNCGVLALIAFFRAANMVALRKAPKDIVKKWNCASRPAAFLMYRKQLANLLTNVVEEENHAPIGRGDSSDKRPRKPAGFFYFQATLPGLFQDVDGKLQTSNDLRYE